MRNSFLDRHVFAFFFTTFFLFSFAVLPAQNNSAKQDGLKGNVKSCEEIIYPAAGIEAEKIISHYDKQGRKMLLENYGKKNAKGDSLIFQYSFLSDTITTFLFTENKMLFEHTVSIYGENRFLKEWNYFPGNSTDPHDHKIYCRKNNFLVADTMISNSGIYRETIAEKFLNDSNGNILRKERTEFNSSGISVEKNVFEYRCDASGNDTLELHYCFYGIKNDSMRLCDKTVYQYDKEGNVISAKKMSGNGKVLTEYSVAYQYDSQGNWTKKTTIYLCKEYYPLSSKIPDEVVVRRIFYY